MAEIQQQTLVVPDAFVGPNLQAAINQAANLPSQGQPRAAVWIPATYPGNDTYTNPYNVPVFDMRNGGSISFANGAVLPNTALAFSATPSFNVAQSTSYTMTLTGNVTSSSTTGTPKNGNLLSLTLIQDGTGTHTFAFPANFILPVGYAFDTTANHTNAVTFKFDGINWNLISNAGSGGSGIAVQTGGVNNTNQSVLNFITSTTNATGLTNTPSNPASGNEKIEVTGTVNTASGGTGVSNPTAHAVLVGEGSSPLNGVLGTVTGQTLTAVNGADPTFSSPGLPLGNSGSPVTTTPYTIQCDSATTLIDRGRLVDLQSGASVVTVPQSSASGCTGNFVTSAMNESGGTVTFNRTGSDTFTVVSGSNVTTGATSFTLPQGAFVTLSNGNSTVWQVRITQGSAPGGSSGAVQFNNSGVFGGFGNWNGSVLALGANALTLNGSNVCLSSGTNCPTTGADVIYETAFGVKADAIDVPDASSTNGSNTYTITEGLFNASTDVGKRIWGSCLPQNSGAMQISAVNSTNSVNVTFVSSGLPVNASGTVSGTCELVWGTDDTAAKNSAYAALLALPKCGMLQLAGGNSIVSSALWQTVPPAQCGSGGSAAGEANGIIFRGTGRNTTVIYPSNDFDFTTCGGTCFGPASGGGGPIWLDFSFYGSTNSCSSRTIGARTAIKMYQSSYMSNFSINSWCNVPTSGTLVATQWSGQQTAAYGSFVDAAGTTACSVQALNVTWYNMFCGNTNQAVSVNATASLQTYGLVVNAAPPANGSCVLLGNGGSGAQWFSFGDSISCGNNTNVVAINNSNGAVARLHGTLVVSGTAATNKALFYNSTTGDVYAINSKFTSSAGNWINGSNTGIRFFDEGGNTFSGTTSYSGHIYGSASITGTAQTSGNWSVPAGSGAGQWGTSPSVGSCDNNANSLTQICTITVGSGTVGSNPVLTITQPTGFVAAPMCNASMIGGTATFSNFTTGTVTTTSAAFTYNGTPAASSTITLKVSCSN